MSFMGKEVIQDETGRKPPERMMVAELRTECREHREVLKIARDLHRRLLFMKETKDGVEKDRRAESAQKSFDALMFHLIPDCLVPF